MDEIVGILGEVLAEASQRMLVDGGVAPPAPAALPALDASTGEGYG